MNLLANSQMATSKINRRNSRAGKVFRFSVLITTCVLLQLSSSEFSSAFEGATIDGSIDLCNGGETLPVKKDLIVTDNLTVPESKQSRLYAPMDCLKEVKLLKLQNGIKPLEVPKTFERLGLQPHTAKCELQEQIAQKKWPTDFSPLEVPTIDWSSRRIDENDGKQELSDPKFFGLKEETNTEIVTSLEQSEIPPVVSRHIKIGPLCEEEAPRARAIILSALSLYPSSILEKNLRRVYVVKSLNVDNLKSGGAWLPGVVFVTDPAGLSAEQIESLFHREFSSILFWNNHKLFDEKAWCEQNPASFAYHGLNEAILKNWEHISSYTSAQPSNGFVNDYATTDIENDFNQLAGGLWLGEPKLWVMSKFPRIQGKINLAIDFYSALNPKLNKEFFQHLLSERIKKRSDRRAGGSEASSVQSR